VSGALPERERWVLLLWEAVAQVADDELGAADHLI
jgi:hypothetical protein